MKYLSGLQPSGPLHLGNYFGAIKQHLELPPENSAYFIADYHALTSIHDASLLKKHTLEIAAIYLALGLDTSKCLFYKQSDIPEVTELAWILSTVVNTGVLERCHAYKDKVEKGLTASVGLFSYPILMAADILLFDTECVPVGYDQIQHIELASDIAKSFNAVVGQEILVQPKYKVTKGAKVLGKDGQKMSKSYHNTIPIFSDDYLKEVKDIKTDGKNYLKEPLTTQGDITFELFSLFLNSEDQESLKIKYEKDFTFGYGHAKKYLAEVLEKTFKESREKYKELLNFPNIIQLELEIGGKRARELAQRKIKEVRNAVGLATEAPELLK